MNDDYSHLLIYFFFLLERTRTRKYHYKKVPYFDGLAIIIGDDEASGRVGATGVEADIEMDPIEVISMSFPCSMLPSY